MFRKIWNRLFGTAISAPEALQEEAPQPVASIPPPRAAKAEVAPDGPLFSGFDLQPSLAQGIRDAGFQRCTPIQAQTLPLALTPFRTACKVSWLPVEARAIIGRRTARRPYLFRRGASVFLQIPQALEGGEARPPLIGQFAIAERDLRPDWWRIAA